MTDDGYRSHFVTATDGLRLHLREYGDRTLPGPPVVCLPGLTRTAADFHPLACALANDPAHPRRVLALDYRGRGLSAYDPNPDHYAIPVELDDALTVMTACEAMPAVLVGTSRGGLITMAMAAVRPTAIVGAVLNDIGPVIEPAGITRIKTYVGRAGSPSGFAEGAAALREKFAGEFPDWTDEDWLAMAHRTWRQENGHLVPTYDQAIARALAAFDLSKPLPDMWPQFDALGRVPVMVIRGGLSDLLSEATVEAMREHHPGLEAVEVPRQGHAPDLAGDDVIARIAAFVERCAAAHAG
ncbi:alpha/beta hydrolase [Rhodoplanes sp. TEM]|uniref:Alpha/beta hydrolase n=1 Tax=Rhodoplanes tepidamans TaxID=200616 RepID=A0ABT5JGH1_RHOTP|nr:MULTISPECIES: alpha/beta hydrolase [Rhodoplanes]MDC7788711.1 alpha/beta hydrolase [Rhodoplanes tepidamans]MDC7982703.1 alpha/beta hydrolase [Rhodoplanes sp. TEM]MDQ0357647.1 pimeloyl-ACP methyl ester carboxylesterase [Rhodoplanes tepidamans]